jgi:hypothetical protein
MDELERKAVSTFETKPILWKRYVDNISFIWPGNERPIEEFHDHLNTQDEDIKFTMELEVDGCLPFLTLRFQDHLGRYLLTYTGNQPTPTYTYSMIQHTQRV